MHLGAVPWRSRDAKFGANQVWSARARREEDLRSCTEKPQIPFYFHSDEELSPQVAASKVKSVLETRHDRRNRAESRGIAVIGKSQTAIA